MIKSTSRNINILALVITVAIFLLFSLVHNYWIEHDRMQFEVSFNSPDLSQIQESAKNENFEIVTTDKLPEKIEENNVTLNQANWSIEIPEINLYAPICEGTTKEVMNKYVGHFEETKAKYGNVGLAAHNRGYPVNYFQDIKNLKEGSEIIYKHDDFIMVYEVKIIEIIENTNWDYLKNTEDNRITLITCVENEPKYRRCIQGIEKIESEDV